MGCCRSRPSHNHLQAIFGSTGEVPRRFHLLRRHALIMLQQPTKPLTAHHVLRSSAPDPGRVFRLLPPFQTSLVLGPQSAHTAAHRTAF